VKERGLIREKLSRESGCGAAFIFLEYAKCGSPYNERFQPNSAYLFGRASSLLKRHANIQKNKLERGMQPSLVERRIFPSPQKF
jgi:hypothetical protein